MSAAGAAQEWLSERLAGLEPEDFGLGAIFVSLVPLRPPAAFRDAWRVFSPNGGGLDSIATREQLAESSALLIFGSPCDVDQMLRLSQLVQAGDALGNNGPPMLWVLHTVLPDRRPTGADLANLLDLGLDDIVCGDETGFSLALSVQAKRYSIAARTERVNTLMAEHTSRQQLATYLQERVACVTWGYLCARVAPSIPPIDDDLPAGELRQVDGFNFKGFLGRGMFGSVFRLKPVASGARAAEPEQVAKMVSKSMFQDLRSLTRLSRTIGLMTLLRSEKWRHPNLVELYQTYHTPTHILFRMEYGGPENLYQRLSHRHRHREGEECRPLPLGKVTSLITQLVQVLAHLHLGPRVCHRDLKPENICLKETPEHLEVKVTDFDLAVAHKGPSSMTQLMCRGNCGTVPFAAPEVLLQPQYDAMAADMWSLAIVLLEVMCGVEIVERVLELNAQTRQDPEGRSARHVTERIWASFQAPGSAANVLRAHARAELSRIIPAMVEYVDSVLTTHPLERWRTEDALAWLPSFQRASADTDEVPS